MPESTSQATKDKQTSSPAELIDGRIAELGDWRGERLAWVRARIKDAVPDVHEDWKWRGVPTWEAGGILCTGETYQGYVKLTFPKGSSIADPTGIFNAGLGGTRHAIDIHEDDEIDEAAFVALVRSAADVNRG